MSTAVTDLPGRLRIARRRAGFSQEEVADKIGVSSRTYARWERGESSGFFRDLEKIAAAFNTTVDTIVPPPNDDDGRLTHIEHTLETLLSEVHELKRLLTDPERLQRAADELIHGD